MGKAQDALSMRKMSELHLDLCRQSAKHFQDAIDSLKENLRVLEVFVSSGLSEVICILSVFKIELRLMLLYRTAKAALP